MKKSKINFFESLNLLFLLVASLVFVSKELIYIFLLGSIIILIIGDFEKKSKVEFKLKHLIICLNFLFMISCALIIGVSSKYHHLDILKDFFHFTFPVLVIIYGFLISKKITRQVFFKQIIYTGAILSCIHLFNVLANIIYVNDLYNLRKIVGTGYILSVISLSFIIFDVFLGTLKYKKQMLFINIISLITSFSRTSLIILIVFFIFYVIKTRKIKKLLKYIAVSSLLFFSMSAFFPDFTDTFILKMKNTSQEISSDVIFSSEESINNNWRGYEKYISEKNFREENLVNQIFGQGAGSQLDLGLTIKLNQEETSSVPFIHNGYINVLNKFGVLGVLMYVVILLLLFKKNDFLNNAVVVNLILLSLVVGGIFAMNGMWELLIITVFLNSRREG